MRPLVPRPPQRPWRQPRRIRKVPGTLRFVACAWGWLGVRYRSMAPNRPLRPRSHPTWQSERRLLFAPSRGEVGAAALARLRLAPPVPKRGELQLPGPGLSRVGVEVGAPFLAGCGSTFIASVSRGRPSLSAPYSPPRLARSAPASHRAHRMKGSRNPHPLPVRSP